MSSETITRADLMAIFNKVLPPSGVEVQQVAIPSTSIPANSYKDIAISAPTGALGIVGWYLNNGATSALFGARFTSTGDFNVAISNWSSSAKTISGSVRFLVAVGGSDFTPQEIAYSITQTGGNSALDTDQTVFVKCGHVVSFFIRVVTNGTTAAGGDIFTGTMNTSSLIPKVTSGGVGYYAGNSRVCVINTSGTIIIRNTGASIGSSIGNTVYGTYIVD